MPRKASQSKRTKPVAATKRTSRAASPADPTRLSAAQLASLLTAAAKSKVTPQMVRGDVAAGAPTNQDGTLHLVHYTAWLLREVARDGS